MKKLRMLLKLRAWIRSGQLQAGGLVGILAALQTWFATDDGAGMIEALAEMLNMMGGTLNGFLMAVVSAALIGFRAKSEWSLSDKVAGVDQDPAKVAAIEKISDK